MLKNLSAPKRPQFFKRAHDRTRDEGLTGFCHLSCVCGAGTKMVCRKTRSTKVNYQRANTHCSHLVCTERPQPLGRIVPKENHRRNRQLFCCFIRSGLFTRLNTARGLGMRFLSDLAIGQPSPTLPNTAKPQYS